MPQLGLLAHDGVVHASAIGAAQVGHRPTPARPGKSRVFGRHGGVCQHQVRLLPTAQGRPVWHRDDRARRKIRCARLENSQAQLWSSAHGLPQTARGSPQDDNQKQIQQRYEYKS